MPEIQTNQKTETKEQTQKPKSRKIGDLFSDYKTNRMAQYRSLAESGSNSRKIRSQGDDALHRGTYQNPFMGRPKRGEKIHDRDLRG